MQPARPIQLKTSAADPTQIAQASPGRCADAPRGRLLLLFKHRFEPQVTKVILIPNGEASLLAFKHWFEPLQELRPGQAHDTYLLVAAGGPAEELNGTPRHIENLGQEPHDFGVGGRIDWGRGDLQL